MIENFKELNHLMDAKGFIENASMIIDVAIDFVNKQRKAPTFLENSNEEMALIQTVQTIKLKLIDHLSNATQALIGNNVKDFSMEQLKTQIQLGNLVSVVLDETVKNEN